MTTPHDTLHLPQTLDNGLVLRLATPADIEPLAEFNTELHLEEGEPPDFLREWTRALMSGRHPTMSAADFIVVEDPGADHKIVSATCLIPQVWAYEDIPFTVGRPELVGTDPAYRYRGLARIVMHRIHELSAAYGHQVQAITGIPWFYRQFGYEYALDLGGGRTLHLDDVPVLKAAEREPYVLRPATEADIPSLLRLYRRCGADKLVTAPFDETRWRYELTVRDYFNRTWCLVDDRERVVGAYTASAEPVRSKMVLWGVIVDEGISIRAVLPGISRALKAHGEACLARQNGDQAPRKLAGLRFALGADHPAYEAFGDRLGPLQPPYGWYMRVPDLPGFIRHITPVLERRLARSVMSGFSGELDLTFYKDGLRLAWEQGRLVLAEAWHDPQPGRGEAGAGFPPLVFLQLLFGYRSLAELRYAFPDCWANPESTLLLNALFPKKPSWVVGLA